MTTKPRKAQQDITRYFRNEFETKRHWYLLWWAVFCVLLMKFLWELSDTVPDLSGFIFILFIVTVGCVFFSFTKTTRQVRGIVENTTIYSLANKTALHGGGAFILGIGGVSIDEDEYYVFYKKGRFGLIKDRVPADEVELIMRNDITPSLKTILVPEDDDESDDNEPALEEKTFLFVPKNTIKKQIRLTT